MEKQKQWCREWNGDEPYREDDGACEETYPDGSVKHECWNSRKVLSTEKRGKAHSREDESDWN